MALCFGQRMGVSGGFTSAGRGPAIVVQSEGIDGQEGPTWMYKPGPIIGGGPSASLPAQYDVPRSD